jgi:hypothetical protein
MRLTRDEQRILGTALMELASGDARRFLDMMWLGFGDGWTPIVDTLAEKQYLQLPDPDGYDTVKIAERGLRLAQRLQGRLAQTA